MKQIKIKEEEIINIISKNIFDFKNNTFKIRFVLFLNKCLYLIIILLASKIINSTINKIKDIQKKELFKNMTNFDYHLFEREMITEKMIKYADWQLLNNEPYFINGIIRKLKPKKCLEIGVAYGGASIIILNALKDINNSFLVSLDLSSNLYSNNSLKTGCRVEQYFPELLNKWHLYTGEQSHKFLDRLNMTFDFLFLDTRHTTPGELINIIEVLPFLDDNAIIVLHDIMFHLPSHNYISPREVKYHPSNIFLMTSLYGDKIIINNKEKGAENIGAIFLYPNQKRYYLNYFLLLLTPWEYMPDDIHLNELRAFIEKYYKNEIYLNLFNRAIEENKIYINKFKTLYRQIFK